LGRPIAKSIIAHALTIAVCGAATRASNGDGTVDFNIL
jgi:hypothetical protein